MEIFSRGEKYVLELIIQEMIVKLQTVLFLNSFLHCMKFS